MQHRVQGCLFTTGAGKFIEIEGKIDGCRKNLQEIVLQSQEHSAHETIHLPADRPHRAEVTVECLKIKKVNILQCPSQIPHLTPIERLQKYCSQIVPIQLAKSNSTKQKKGKTFQHHVMHTVRHILRVIPVAALELILNITYR